MIRSGGPSGEACPVCPYRGLSGMEAACPSCGTDLSVLRALQALPASILDQGVGLAARGDIEGALPLLQAAAVFPGTRDRAVALILGIVERCPNRECTAFRRRGKGRMALARTYGAAATPIWRCRTCRRSVSGARNSVLFRSRLPKAEAYRVLAELLTGATVPEITGRVSRSAVPVRRIARRAATMGPRVIDEIAAATGRPASELRVGWRRFARAVRSAGSRPG